MKRILVALTMIVGSYACAAAPKPQVVPVAPMVLPKPPSPPFEVKQSWILRLEDQRILRDAGPGTAPVDAGAPVDAAAASIAVPDLVRLLSDDEARIRRRAALAVGRVGLREGVAPLVALLADGDPEVSQMAAFSLGLIGDAAAKDPLIAQLDAASLLMKGSAAEALGLIGDASVSAPVARMASQLLQSRSVTEAALAGITDDGRDGRDSAAAAFRLALFALVRLKAYPELSGVVLDEQGQPRLRAWPVAFALQRLEDPRALPALRALAADSDPTTRAFAVKGLGALKDRESLGPLATLVISADPATAIESMRALGRIGDPAALPTVLQVLRTQNADPFLKIEAVTALGLVGGEGAFNAALDMLVDRNPVVRTAALRSLGQLDQATFAVILSGLDPDADFTVRSALATVLGTMGPEAALPRLRLMLDDTDQRVIPSVIAALAKLRAPDATAIAIARLKADDVIVRAAAAAALGDLKPTDGVTALADAYRADTASSYTARAAMLTAVALYGAEAARPVLQSALQDKDWAVRVRAATLLTSIDPASDAEQRIRPAPTRLSAETYAAQTLVNPRFSTEAYIETERGIIQLQLAVLDAPLAVENFVTLANQGFFNGLNIHRVVPNFVIQMGDPRGDSEGGPGYSIRDELSERSYLRGTVGIALDWEDTGGSQFFIAHSPQPHLDDRYTVIGRVTAGMDVVDRIQQGDVIRQIKIWDGN